MAKTTSKPLQAFLAEDGKCMVLWIVPDEKEIGAFYGPKKPALTPLAVPKDDLDVLGRLCSQERGEDIHRAISNVAKAAFRAGGRTPARTTRKKKVRKK